MTTDTTYNGWTNSETWRVNLWVSNDEYTDAEARRICHEASDSYDAGKALREFVESEMLGDAIEGASLASDILNAAMREVSWEEIAEAYREDVDDDDEGDEVTA